MKSYRVCGGARFQGHAPGEVFEAEFTEAEECRYFERGAIELADPAEAVAPEGSVETPPDPDGDGQTQSPGVFDQDD